MNKPCIQYARIGYMCFVEPPKSLQKYETNTQIKLNPFSIHSPPSSKPNFKRYDSKNLDHSTFRNKSIRRCRLTLKS